MLSLDNFILKHNILCCDVTIDAIDKIETIRERYTHPKRTSDLYLSCHSRSLHSVLPACKERLPLILGYPRLKSSIGLPVTLDLIQTVVVANSKSSQICSAQSCCLRDHGPHYLCILYICCLLYTSPSPRDA